MPCGIDIDTLKRRFSKPVSYRLFYFAGVRNIAEPIKLALIHASVPFEDIRYTQNEWPDHKNKTPYGHVPVLEVNGQSLSESMTILRFVARRCGLAGSTAFDEAKVDELLSVHQSEYSELGPWFYVMAGFKQGDTAALYESHARPVTRKYFAIWSQTLKEARSGFLVGRRLTVADLAIADFLFSIDNLAPGLFDDFHDLRAYHARILSLPSIRDYVATRARTLI